MDDDVTRALAIIRQEQALLKSALGVNKAADAEAVIRKLVFAVENMGDSQGDDEAVIAQLVTAVQNQGTDLLIIRRDIAVLSGIIAATHPVTTHGSLSFASVQIAVVTTETMKTSGGIAGAPYSVHSTIVPVSPSSGSLAISAYGISGTEVQAFTEAQGSVVIHGYSTSGTVIIGAVG